MEKSEKAKQLRALRKYGKKVRRKVARDRMMLGVFVRPDCPGLIWFHDLYVFDHVFVIS